MPSSSDAASAGRPCCAPRFPPAPFCFGLATDFSAAVPGPLSCGSFPPHAPLRRAPAARCCSAPLGVCPFPAGTQAAPRAPRPSSRLLETVAIGGHPRGGPGADLHRVRAAPSAVCAPWGAEPLTSRCSLTNPALQPWGPLRLQPPTTPGPSARLSQLCHRGN